jgi:hypothetical protein
LAPRQNENPDLRWLIGGALDSIDRAASARRIAHIDW